MNPDDQIRRRFAPTAGRRKSQIAPGGKGSGSSGPAANEATPGHHKVDAQRHNSLRPDSALRRSNGNASPREPIFLVYAILFALAMPPEAAVFIGPMKFTVYRIVLILAFFPSIFRLFSGKIAPFNAIDAGLLIFIMLSINSLILAHGVAETWEFAGLLFLETAGPYLIARCYITSAFSFRRFVVAYFCLVLFLLPFAAYETLTGTHILRDIARAVFGGSAVIGRPPRWGLDRAFGPFEHPILYGVFCASVLGMVLHVTAAPLSRLVKGSIIALATFFSLSTGPLTAFMVQAILLGYDRVTLRMGVAHRWKLLILGFFAAYMAVDLLSNRTPFHVFVTYLSFNLQSSYNRILIWEYGTQSVWNNPVFGIGLGEWERPHYMSSSMDNFWLLIAVRYGVPALLALAIGIGVLLYRVAKAHLEPEAGAYRKGWYISMVGMMVAGTAVHFWASLYILFMVMLGASMWMLSGGERRRTR